MNNMDKIELLKQTGVIQSLDFYFSLFISQLSGSADFSLLLAACLVSRATANKHVCLSLSDISGRVIVEPNDTHGSVTCPEVDEWVTTLKKFSVVGNPGEFKPLVLDEKNRLYLYRYWQYQKILAEEINKRAAGTIPVDAKQLEDSLNRLFPETDKSGVNRQQIAAWTCALKRICIITGGPGTGKTTTVAKILAVLTELTKDQELNIVMAAPTGKAAVRLKESIITAKKNLDADKKIIQAIPEDPQTLHRVLGPLFGTPYFQHNQHNPLNADIVIVDEASMVDIALMAKLIQAVAEHARLILIGDKDQLASVEAGSVLGDICEVQNADIPPGLRNFFKHPLHSHSNVSELPKEKAERPVAECIVRLTKSYRFTDSHNMDALIQAVKTNDFNHISHIFKASDNNALEWLHFKTQDRFQTALEKNILEGYTPYLKSPTVLDALTRFENYKILCAVNKGPWGVQGINRIAESVLMSRKLIQPQGQWYAGQPVLINQNDYTLDVFNGDMGIIWPESDREGARLYAYFPDKSGSIKKILPGRLPRHETAFAMTIHKTQGSEFDAVLMILPDYDTPLLTRELLYTGITRARSKLALWSDPKILKTVLSRKIQRHSGLRDLL